MKLLVQYQFEDYREAQAAHNAGVAQPTESQQTLYAAFMFASIGVYMVCAEFFTGYFAESENRLRLADQTVPMIPWIAILAALWTYQFRASRRLARAPWDAPYVAPIENQTWRSWKLVAVAWGVICMFGLMFFCAWRSPRPELGDVLVISFVFGMIPWQIYALWTATLQKATATRALRRTWERMPQQGVPHMIEFDDWGIVVECEMYREEYKWRGIVGYLETPNLILLYPSQLAFHMIPKRYFPTDADLDLFYGLLHRSVASGRFLPRAAGFPVQPAAPVQPRGNTA